MIERERERESKNVANLMETENWLPYHYGLRIVLLSIQNLSNLQIYPLVIATYTKQYVGPVAQSV